MIQPKEIDAGLLQKLCYDYRHASSERADSIADRIKDLVKTIGIDPQEFIDNLNRQRNPSYNQPCLVSHYE